MVDAIEVKETGRIICDTDGCDFRQSVPVADREKWVDRPCPDCGANLLTRESYENGQTILEAARLLNELFGEVEDGQRIGITVNTGRG